MPDPKDFFTSFDEFNLNDEKRLAVAVSGGPDSMALCFLLSRYAEQCGGFDIHALTVDHGLRADSATEAENVGIWLKDLPHVTHVTLKRDVTEKQKQSKIQEDARRDRYALMARYCHDQDIKKLLLAHHMDDQAETFLFRLAKGSGLDGLSAMKPAHHYDGLMLLRPFLKTPKQMLIDLCDANDIPYVCDPSNVNENFARPRLRKAANVLAEEGLTPKRVSVTALRLNRAREALDFYAFKAFDDALIEQGSEDVRFKHESLKHNPPEIRLRVLLRVLDMMRRNADYAPRMEKLENLECRIFDDPDFKSATLGGVLFSVDREKDILSLALENKPSK